MKFELLNTERKYFGLEPINPKWEKMYLKPGPYQPESVLYFDGETIKKQIISNPEKYTELQFELKSRNKEFLQPKTAKGKEKKITAAVIEQQKPIGVSFNWMKNSHVNILNYTTQKTFYSTLSENLVLKNVLELKMWIDRFIQESTPNHITEIEKFKSDKRERIKYKIGDFFAFKIRRNKFGFGRILLDIRKLNKSIILNPTHGLNLLMSVPLLVKIYAFTSEIKKVDLKNLSESPSLPSFYLMDNPIFYGEYEIIGNRNLTESEFDFPISYGRSIIAFNKTNFLQWGLIHLENNTELFSKGNQSQNIQNPFGNYSVTSKILYNANEIEEAEVAGYFDFSKSEFYNSVQDLRNPANAKIKNEIFINFGLSNELTYEENCKILKIDNAIEMVNKI